jgi:hypothetical protein
MRYCLEVRAYTAVNINVTRVTRDVTDEQMRERRETDQLVKRRGRVCGGLGAEKWM